MPIIGVSSGEAVIRPRTFDPLPTTGLPEMNNIAYWFSAGHKVFRDPEGIVPASDGDRVGFWGNNGNKTPYRNESAIQPESDKRPILRYDGQGEQPYLQCDRASEQHFNDLTQFKWPSGVGDYGQWHAFAAVIEAPNDGIRKPIFGFGHETYAKCDFYIDTNGQVRTYKSQWNFGDMRPVGAHAFALSAPGSGCQMRRAFDTSTASQTNNCTNPASALVGATQFLRKGPEGLFFHGRLYELIMWNTPTTFSLAQINQIMSYLRPKYGI